MWAYIATVVDSPPFPARTPTQRQQHQNHAMTAYYANDNISETPQPKPSRIKARHAYIAVIVLAIAFTATYRIKNINATVDGYGVVSACLTPTGLDHELCHRQIDSIFEAVARFGYRGEKACPPNNINHDQMIHSIIHSLSENPDMLIRSAEDLIASAAIKAFPCRLNYSTVGSIE